MAKKKICIDAGHYGKYNRSPAIKSYYESDMAWKLHMMQKKHLEKYGFEVILTRSNQGTDKALYDRGAMSRGCDLFISDHSNAVGSGVNESVDYPVAYVSINGKGNELGQKLANCIASVMGTKQKGTISSRRGNNGDYYGVIRGATAVGTVGMILEHSFHTNSRATKWLLNDSNLDRLAAAEAKVIAEHFGMSSGGSSGNGSGGDAVNAGKEVKPLSGTLKVIYKGADGLNVRTSPEIKPDNVNQIIHNGTYTVVGVTADGKWYKLKSGLFITSGEKYVKFTAGSFAPYTVCVDIDDLKIREAPGTDKKWNGKYTGKGSFTIVAEADGKGATKWGLLKAYEKNKNGWISLDYAKRV